MWKDLMLVDLDGKWKMDGIKILIWMDSNNLLRYKEMVCLSSLRSNLSATFWLPGYGSMGHNVNQKLNKNILLLKPNSEMSKKWRSLKILSLNGPQGLTEITIKEHLIFIFCKVNLQCLCPGYFFQKITLAQGLRKFGYDSQKWEFWLSEGWWK